MAPTVPTAPQPAHSLTQVREATCRAFTRRAAQGDTELLANLPDQRSALQHTALACLVGMTGRLGRDGGGQTGTGPAHADPLCGREHPTDGSMPWTCCSLGPWCVTCTRPALKPQTRMCWRTCSAATS